MPPEVVELLQGSKNTLIQELFQLKRNCTQDNDSTRTVSVLPCFNELKHLILFELSRWFLRQIATENQSKRSLLANGSVQTILNDKTLR